MMVSVVGPFIEGSILVLPFHYKMLLIGQLSRVNIIDHVESGHLSFGWRAVVEGAIVRLCSQVRDVGQVVVGLFLGVSVGDTSGTSSSF